MPHFTYTGGRGRDVSLFQHIQNSWKACHDSNSRNGCSDCVFPSTVTGSCDCGGYWRGRHSSSRPGLTSALSKLNNEPWWWAVALQNRCRLKQSLSGLMSITSLGCNGTWRAVFHWLTMFIQSLTYQEAAKLSQLKKSTKTNWAL